MPHPRTHQQWHPRPSPLAKVHHRDSRLSSTPKATPHDPFIRDPEFWKRFSTAVHRTDAEAVVIDVEKEGGSARSASTSVSSRDGNNWLAQQHKEKRRCRMVCGLVTLGVVVVVVAAVVVGLWFTRFRKA